MQRPGAAHRAKAREDEPSRHDTDLNTWPYEDPQPGDKPIPYVMTFEAKINMYGGLERCKVRCAARGDHMRPSFDFDEMRTASHMPPQARRRLLIAACASDEHDLQS